MRAPVWICLVLGGGILCSWERFGCVPVAAIDKPSLRTLTDEALALPVPEMADPFAPPSSKAPPPPPMLEPGQPPRRIADFMRAHANDPDPWQVTLYWLRAPGERVPERRQFMGRRVLSRADLPPARAAALVERLMRRESYFHSLCAGITGCTSIDSFGLRIARGGERLDLAENCGRIVVSAADGSGEMAFFSESMSTELQRLVDRLL
jgi:hypothetical protein